MSKGNVVCRKKLLKLLLPILLLLLQSIILMELRAQLPRTMPPMVTRMRVSMEIIRITMVVRRIRNSRGSR